MADDMETQRRAYTDLIVRSEELRVDLDRTAAAYRQALAELERSRASRGWRALNRILGRETQQPADQSPPPVMTDEPADGAAGADPRPGPVQQDAPQWPWVDAPTTGDRAPSVSIIIPTRDQPELLAAVIRTLDATLWSPMEVIFVDNGTTDPTSLQLLAGTGHSVVAHGGAFNFPRLVQAGVEASSGEILVLLNNDVESSDPGWLHELVAALDSPGCGVAGSLLLYPDGRIQHIGVVMDEREPIHALLGVEPADAPPEVLARPRRCTAVTGACMAIRRSTWDALGGLDPLFARNYNDVDLCLRAASAGLATVVTPRAVLTHKESATRGSTWDSEIAAEGLLFRARWADQLDKADPYWPGTVDPRTGAVGGSRP